MEKDDSQLVVDYLAGETSALQELINRYTTDVRRFVLKLVAQPQAADDITQDAFVQAWQHIRSFRPGKSFRAWVFTIAHNKAVDFLRARREIAQSHFEHALADGAQASNTSPFSTLATEEAGPAELFERAQDVVFVQSLLAELKPEYREVLLMKEGQATFAEMSTTLAKPLNTVKSQYRRALAALREAFLARKTQ
jgi:RNA polymerase sigma-70 factor (ECF subfamily)